MKKRLITSALPYVNNIPHLGNLIQVLSADVFARFCRLRGYDTLYVCGTDEYGTATETKALEEGITPQELCDRYYAVHTDIYNWFTISFDRFGRTSTPKHTEITQGIFNKLDENGYITEQTTEQLYCSHCDRFLADRYVRGTCPHCGYEEARGDQCEQCGKLLDPVELVGPRCGVCGGSPQMRETSHLYVDLPAILPKLQKWIDDKSVEGFWARNAIQMTQAWIRDGLRERCITRDLKWGIPVPKDGYRDKVFYVWFDAPIGYISITANYTDEWEKWWKNPKEVELFQFIGKDNIPFHTVIFPSSLLGTGEPWTTLHHMSSTEYMNYESGKFSKSKGVGVFGNDVKDTGIPSDVWRFYMYYVRPEKADSLFTWKDFQMKVNTELIGNLSNLVNRTLTFVSRFYDGKVPDLADDGPTGGRAETGADIAKKSAKFWEEAGRFEGAITALLERAELREGFKQLFALAAMGNKVFQDGEPWKQRKERPEVAAALIRDLVYLVKDLAILMEPYLPTTAERIRKFLGLAELRWDDLGKLEGLSTVGKPDILFQILEDDQIENLRVRFSGTQKERKEKMEQEKEITPERQFAEKVTLKVAKITEVQRHPQADKLYLETIDVGDGEIRQIVSGLVPYYKEEELLGRNIILVENLKPAKLRGEKSEGMLLAAEAPAEGETDGAEESDSGQHPSRIEVLFVDHAVPGDAVVLEGEGPTAGNVAGSSTGSTAGGAAESAAGETAGKEPSAKKRIKIDEFFEIPLTVENNTVYVGSKPLVCNGKPITTDTIASGKVG